MITNCSEFCNLQIASNNQICSGDQVSVPVIVGATTTVTWSASPAGIVQFGCSTCSQTTVTGNGTVTLTANITSNCGNFTVTKQITVASIPLPPIITNLNYDAQCGSFMEAYSNNPATATGYIWNLNFGQVIQDGASDYFYVAPLINSPLTGQSYYNYLSVQAKNACGVSDPSETRPFTVGPVPSTCSGGGCCLLRVSPNPSNSTTEVILTDKEDKTKKKDIQEIRIIDKMGNIKQTIQYGKGKQAVILDVASLPFDIYTIQAFDGKEWFSTKFSKK